MERRGRLVNKLSPLQEPRRMDFSVEVVKKALLLSNSNGENKNVVSSPLSIAAMLHILAVGSKTLSGVKTNYSKLAAVTADVASSSEHGNGGGGGNEDEGPLINFVNGAWVNQLYALNPSFEYVLKSVFNVETRTLDFQNKLDEAIDEMNSWVKKATNGLIDKIAGSNAIEEDTTIILANALYFKGNWESEFNPSMTTDCDFYLVNGKKVLAPFMHGDTEICYFYRSFDTFKVAKMPYKSRGGDQRLFSMHLFLPNERGGLPNLLKEFSHNPSLFLKEKLAESMVELDAFLIPKFEFSYGFEVSNLIEGLGLEIGELTEMIEDGDGNGASFGGARIFHKALIIVNEGGTEAAAETDCLYYGCCMPESPPPPRPTFVADHPFMFMIKEDNSGTPFFIGVVLNPLLDQK